MTDGGVTIIGPGRVGQALGRLLARAGVNIAFVAARRAAAARQAVRFIGAGRALNLRSNELAQAGVVLLTTSDSALPEIAKSLACRRRDWKGSVVLHTSGAWPASGANSVLEPLRAQGANVGSMHPLQTVPNREAGARKLLGCFWAIEGDPAGLRLAREWVRLLRGTAFVIDPDRKASYHAAAVISCGGVVALMETSRRLLACCGVAPAKARTMLRDFVTETAGNFARLGVPRALTGPAVRGDSTTINRHLRALRQDAPESVALYRELTRRMLVLAGRQNQPPKRRSLIEIREPEARND